MSDLQAGQGAPGESPIIQDWLARTLERVKSGEISVSEATRELCVLPYEEMSFAKVDHHRHMRVGFPEVVFGRGKTMEQIVAIVERLAARADKVLVTRAGPEAFSAVKEKIADAVYNPLSGTIVVNRATDRRPDRGRSGGHGGADGQ
jgi:NCAIR mutase (PurE)-related protein